MKPALVFARSAAILSSLLLAGGYIYYRAATASRAASPPAASSDSTTISSSKSGMIVQSADLGPATQSSPTRGLIMSGSKSLSGAITITSAPSTISVTQPASQPSPEVTRTLIMPTSKSSGSIIDISRRPPPPPPAPVVPSPQQAQGSNP